MPSMANSYGVSPPILSDAELQAAAGPVIQAEVAKRNQQLAAKGITTNEFMQYQGKGVTSTGKPPGDHYQLWIQQVPAVKEAMARAAQEAYNRKLKELTDQEIASAPPPPPPPQNPTSQAVGKSPGAVVESR